MLSEATIRRMAGDRPPINDTEKGELLERLHRLIKQVEEAIPLIESGKLNPFLMTSEFPQFLIGDFEIEDDAHHERCPQCHPEKQ